MPEGLYTLVWTRTAVADIQKLDPEVAHHVLNNVPTLVRDPFPPFSDATGEGWYLLHVGAASVAYEVIGFTVTLLVIHTIGTGHR